MNLPKGEYTLTSKARPTFDGKMEISGTDASPKVKLKGTYASNPKWEPSTGRLSFEFGGLPLSGVYHPTENRFKGKFKSGPGRTEDTWTATSGSSDEPKC